MVTMVGLLPLFATGCFWMCCRWSKGGSLCFAGNDLSAAVAGTLVAQVGQASLCRPAGGPLSRWVGRDFAAAVPVL
jgi:hypothetical protein